VLLPFLAGAWIRRDRWAVAAGALAGAAMIAGFYGFLFVGDVTNSQLDLPASVTARTVVVDAYRRWLGTFLLGQPGGIPWLTIGALGGAAAGWLGHRWRTGRATWAIVLVAGALVLEPVGYLLAAAGLPMIPRYGLAPANLALWTAEAACGLVVIALVLARSRPQLCADTGS
jgi:hypothetical protein